MRRFHFRVSFRCSSPLLQEASPHCLPLTNCAPNQNSSPHSSSCVISVRSHNHNRSPHIERWIPLPLTRHLPSFPFSGGWCTRFSGHLILRCNVSIHEIVLEPRHWSVCRWNYTPHVWHPYMFSCWISYPLSRPSAET